MESLLSGISESNSQALDNKTLRTCDPLAFEVSAFVARRWHMILLEATVLSWTLTPFKQANSVTGPSSKRHWQARAPRDKRVCSWKRRQLHGILSNAGLAPTCYREFQRQCEKCTQGKSCLVLHEKHMHPIDRLLCCSVLTLKLSVLQTPFG